MALRREITSRITNLLQENPQGLSITEIVKSGGINRNTAGRYLDNLLVTGQVEMRHFGMAKIYSLSSRMPVSSVLSISSELVLQLDASLRIVFVNKPFVDLLETAEKELVGKNIEFSKIPLYFDETYPTILEWIHTGIAGTEFRRDLPVPSKKRVFSCRIVPTVFNHGQKGVSILFEDVTRQRQGEILLRESEEKFRALFNNANDMITLHELDENKLHGHYIEVNDLTCRKLKYTRQELLAMAPRDLIARDFMESVGRNTHKLHEDGHATFETVLLTKDLQRIPVEINAHLFDFKGRLVTLAIIRDITRRKEAEDQLHLMKISIDSAYDEIFWMDMKADFLYVNDAACRITGYSREELLAMKVFTLDPDFTPARWERSIQDLRKNKKQVFQTRHRRKDGVILDVEISSVYVTRGAEEYAFCFIRDITERNRIEVALRESEARYRSLSEASQDMIYVVGQEDQILYINQATADFLKKPAAEAIGLPRDAHFPPEVSMHQYTAIQHVFATGQPVRNEGPMNTEGEVRWFDHALVPIPDTEGRVISVLGVSRDITRHIVAEQEQQQSEQNYRFIAEHSVDIIHRLSPDCICTYTSPSVTTLLGYAEADVLGKQVLSMIHPDDLMGVVKDIRAIRESGQDTVTSTIRFRHKDGHYIRFESTTRIVRDISGQVKEFLSISRDITDRKP